MRLSFKIFRSLAGVVILTLVAGCNISLSSPTPFVFPTTNSTAINSPTVPPANTATQVPASSTPWVITATSEPVTATPWVITATSLPATYTPLPSSTPWVITATNVPPTATAVPPTPAVRNNSEAVAYYLSTAPKVDGSWDDLPSSSERAATYLVYKNPSYKGSADTGMSYRIGWDKNYLYIGVKVGDSLYRQVETGDKIYLGDSVEVLIDTNVNNDFNSHTLSLDDYQLGISPGFRTPGNAPEAYLWFPSGKAGSRSDVKIAVKHPSSDLYRIEFAIPWKMLDVTPYTGMHLGFVISYSDNQNGTKSEQDLMVSNDKYRVLTDPTTWGDLWLTN